MRAAPVHAGTSSCGPPGNSFASTFPGNRPNVISQIIEDSATKHLQQVARQEACRRRFVIN